MRTTTQHYRESLSWALLVSTKIISHIPTLPVLQDTLATAIAREAVLYPNSYMCPLGPCCFHDKSWVLLGDALGRPSVREVSADFNVESQTDATALWLCHRPVGACQTRAGWLMHVFIPGRSWFLLPWWPSLCFHFLCLSLLPALSPCVSCHPALSSPFSIPVLLHPILISLLSSSFS